MFWDEPTWNNMTYYHFFDFSFFLIRIPASARSGAASDPKHVATLASQRTKRAQKVKERRATFKKLWKKLERLLTMRLRPWATARRVCKQPRLVLMLLLIRTRLATLLSRLMWTLIRWPCHVLRKSEIVSLFCLDQLNFDDILQHIVCLWWCRCVYKSDFDIPIYFSDSSKNDLNQKLFFVIWAFFCHLLYFWCFFDISGKTTMRKSFREYPVPETSNSTDNRPSFTPESTEESDESQPLKHSHNHLEIPDRGPTLKVCSVGGSDHRKYGSVASVKSSNPRRSVTVNMGSIYHKNNLLSPSVKSSTHPSANPSSSSVHSQTPPNLPSAKEMDDYLEKCSRSNRQFLQQQASAITTKSNAGSQSTTHDIVLSNENFEHQPGSLKRIT